MSTAIYASPTLLWARKAMLVVSNLFSFLPCQQTPTRLSAQACPQIARCSPPPSPAGAATSTVPVGKTRSGLCVKLQFSFLPSPFVPLPFLFFSSGIQMWGLEEKQSPCDHGDHCLPRWEWWSRKKVWGPPLTSSGLWTSWTSCCVRWRHLYFLGQ